MTEFQQAREAAFQELQNFFSIRKMEHSARKKLGLAVFSEVWEVTTEYFSCDDIARRVNLLVCLKADFPVTPPNVRIPKSELPNIGFIPHVAPSGSICLFDEDDVDLNVSKPGQIVKECLDRARTIIEEGVSMKNESDFEEEFLAYWKESYSEREVIFDCLHFLDHLPEPGATVCLKSFQPPYTNFRFLLYDEKGEIESFNTFLKESTITSVTKAGLYLGNYPGLTPPYPTTNIAIAKSIEEGGFDLKHLKKYLNDHTDFPILLFSKRFKNTFIIIGFLVGHLATNRKGYRPGALHPYDVFAKMQGQRTVARLSFTAYTKHRLEVRTSGTVAKTGFKFFMAGLGSIGSNLLPYLKGLPISKLFLVDPDFLTIDNINRHLLGFSYLKQQKVHALRHYLITQDPLTEVIAASDSVTSIIQNQPDEINLYDYLVISIGKTNVENFLIECQQENIIKKPMIVIWVEPYLLGGHMLFLQPQNRIAIPDLKCDGFFRFNVIHQEEYRKRAAFFRLKEAGCQSTYTPYGQRNITLFLSCTISFIDSFVRTGRQDNCILSWRSGDDLFQELNVLPSDYGKAISPGHFVISSL